MQIRFDRDGRMTVYCHSGLVIAKVQKFTPCRQLSCMCLLPEVAPNSVLDTANRVGKCNDDIKMIRQ